MSQIRALICGAALSLAVTSALAGNYATCILDKIGAVKNPASFGATMRSCASDHPRGYLNIKRGSGLGLFGPKNADACIIKYAEETTYPPASGAISAACSCLYGKESFKDEMCEYPEVDFRR